MNSELLAVFAAPLFVACLALPASTQAASASYIECSNGSIYRIAQNDFAEWNPSGQIWDEYCFEGERRSSGGRPMRSSCRIDSQEVRAELTFPGYTGEYSKWTLSRITGRLTFFDTNRGEDESFQCQRTENPIQGEAIF